MPKHRALPPNNNSGRRVPVSAAVDAARAALAAQEAEQADAGQANPGQADHREADAGQADAGQADAGQADAGQADAGRLAAASSPTVPPRRPRARSRPSGSRRPPAGGTSPAQPRRMRGLLVTPWFAAGAGFVIAAALALHAPHTVLTYRPNTSPCSACTSPGALATAQPGLHFKAVQPARPARTSPAPTATEPATGPAPAAVAGPEIGFQVVGQQDGEFTAIITVPAARARHGWNLRFEIPGRRILRVLGANWQPAPGAYGGRASMLTLQTGLPGPPERSHPPGLPGTGRQGAWDHPGASGRPGDRRPWDPAVRFIVTAQGSPATPVACVLNGASCHFG